MSKNNRFSHGDILSANEETKLSNGNGEEYVVEKGDKAIVGFDDYLHLLKENVLISLESMEIEPIGYSATGLSHFLAAWLVDDLGDKLGVDRIEIKQSLENALIVVGMEKTECDTDEEESE